MFSLLPPYLLCSQGYYVQETMLILILMILMLYLVDMSNLRVGRNILVNRLSVLNNQIKHDWMNCSLKTYKVKCKTLFLTWTARKRGIVINIHWQIYFFKCKPQFYNEIINGATINASYLKKYKNYFILCLVVQPGLQSPSYCCGSCTTHRYLVTHTILHTLPLSLTHAHTHTLFNKPLQQPPRPPSRKWIRQICVIMLSKQ